MKKILALAVIVISTITLVLASCDNKATNEYIGGEWVVTECNGKAIVEGSESVPFVVFNLEDGKVYGNNSCNVINGLFTVGDNQALKIENLISTMMACHNAPQEAEIMQSLNGAVKYDVAEVDGKEFLNLIGEKADTLLTLKRHDMTFLNGTWRVEALADSLVELNDAKLVLDVNEKTIHGNSGCNIVNGVLDIDRSKDNAIQFSALASTRMMCPNIQFETELLLALENTETAAVGANEDQVIFFDANSQPVLTLKREMECTTPEAQATEEVVE